MARRRGDFASATRDICDGSVAITVRVARDYPYGTGLRSLMCAINLVKALFSR
jgi:hypothetical protein